MRETVHREDVRLRLFLTMVDPLTPAVVEALLRRSAWTRRAALACVRDPDLAEDLRQDAYLKVLKGCPHPERGVFGWFQSILRRLAIDRARAESSRRIRELRNGSSEAQASDGDVVERAELLAIVHEELMALQDPYRRVLLRAFYDDLELADIARRDGVPEPTIRSRMRRGLGLLRERLERRLGNSERWRRAIPLAVGGWSRIPNTGAWWMAMSKAKVVGGVVSVIALIAMVSTHLLDGAESTTVGTASDPIVEVVTPPRIEAAVEQSRVEVVAARAALAESAPRIALEPVSRSLRRGDSILRGVVIDADARVAVAGASVELVEPGGETTVSATTSSLGEFTLDFADLRSSCSLQVMKDGFAPSFVAVDDVARPTRDRNEYDIGVISMERGETIAGFVRHQDDTPAAYCPLYLRMRGVVASGFQPRWSQRVGVTDREGRFEIRGVEPTEASREHDLFAFLEASAASLAGAGGTTLRVPRGVGRVEGVVIELAPPLPLRVAVTNHSGNPVPGAVVTAEPRFEPWVNPYMSTQEDGRNIWGPRPVHGMNLGDDPTIVSFFRATTDREGIAWLDAFPRPIGRNRDLERFDVYVSARGYRPAWIDDLDPNKIPPRVEIDLEPLRLHRIEGIVKDADSAPIAGTKVFLTRHRSEDRFDEFPAATTDESGRFSFDGVPGGDHFGVGARPASFLAASLPVDLTSPDCSDVVSIELAVSRGYPIRGRFVDQFDRPIALRFVGAALEAGSERLTPIAKTDGRGAFEYLSSFPGEQTIGGYQFEFPVGEFVDTHPRWNVSPGPDEQVFVVERSPAYDHRIVVEVVTESGTPLDVESAWLLSEPRDERRRAPHGRFSLGRVEFESVPPGQWSLEVIAVGFEPMRRSIEVAPSDRSLSIRMEPVLRRSR